MSKKSPFPDKALGSYDDVLERLAGIEDRHKAATPGPWSSAGGAVFCQNVTEDDSRGPFPLYDAGSYVGPSCNIKDDGAFIANARSDIPWLLILASKLLKRPGVRQPH